MSNSIHNNIVCFGEILWDILPTEALPGGAPMNVAYHLHQLGEKPALLTRIGIDERGRELLNILQGKQIDTSHVQLDYDRPTGIVHATANAQGEMKYEIVSPAAWDYIVADEASVDLVKQAQYFIFGSLITREKSSREALLSLLEAAQTKVLDINLRPPHYSRLIVEELLTKADIVKMNIAELELITGWFAEYNSTEERMELLQERFNVPILIVTMGEEGAVINYKGKWYRHHGYKVVVADTIGSGDSFLAAFLSRIIAGELPDAALNFASGLGALVASRKGAWPDYHVEEIYHLIKSGSSGIQVNS
ncbi:MAG: carbohydrate kinase [Chitinophagaceae bacterium]|nr:MAG: carbohydrate kinase [Chitinophagaceae bacterium]